MVKYKDSLQLRKLLVALETKQKIKIKLQLSSIESIIIGDTVIKPLESVRNLGSWFDAHMRMNVHIGKVCSKAFRGLYNIRQISL